MPRRVQHLNFRRNKQAPSFLYCKHAAEKYVRYKIELRRRRWYGTYTSNNAVVYGSPR